MSTPAPASPPKKKTSTLMKVVYAIIILIAVSLVLQALGVGIVNKHEESEMIERPHGG